MFDLPPVSHALDEAIRHAIDTKTKPLGALGGIETLAAQIARIQGTVAPSLRRCRLILFAADHGIANEGVSAYPQAVTRQMVANFLGGGAAANVFARENGVVLTVVDAGVAGDAMDAPGLVSRRIAAGTRSFATEPAMTVEQCDAALSAGLALGERVERRRRVRGDGDREHLVGEPRRPQAHRGRARPAGRSRHRARRRRARAQARGPGACRVPDRAPARPGRCAARVRRLRGGDDGRGDDRRGPGRGGGARGRVHRERRGRPPWDSLLRSGTTSSSRIAPPSRATGRCSKPSTHILCSTSRCASAKAPGRCSPGRCSGARRRCSRTWRASRARGSVDRRDEAPDRGRRVSAPGAS